MHICKLNSTRYSTGLVLNQFVLREHHGRQLNYQRMWELARCLLDPLEWFGSSLGMELYFFVQEFLNFSQQVGQISTDLQKVFYLFRLLLVDVVILKLQLSSLYSFELVTGVVCSLPNFESLVHLNWANLTLRDKLLSIVVIWQPQL